MRNKKYFLLIAFTLFLGLAGFEVAAEPHYCAAHCASHTDTDAKMCMTHCTTGVAENHDCTSHCKNMPANDQDQACATHCSS